MTQPQLIGRYDFVVDRSVWRKFRCETYYEAREEIETYLFYDDGTEQSMSWTRRGQEVGDSFTPDHIPTAPVMMQGCRDTDGSRYGHTLADAREMFFADTAQRAHA